MPITLKAARINAKLTQRIAAKELGIRAATLSKYEAGKTFPAVPTIRKIEKLYSVPYSDINFLP